MRVGWSKVEQDTRMGGVSVTERPLRGGLTRANEHRGMRANSERDYELELRLRLQPRISLSTAECHPHPHPHPHAPGSTLRVQASPLSTPFSTFGRTAMLSPRARRSCFAAAWSSQLYTCSLLPEEPASMTMPYLRPFSQLPKLEDEGGARWCSDGGGPAPLMACTAAVAPPVAAAAPAGGIHSTTGSSYPLVDLFRRRPLLLSLSPHLARGWESMVPWDDITSECGVWV